MRTIAVAGAFVAIGLAFCFASSVTAGPYEDASAALRRGDYATALRQFRSLADQGHAVAQYDLAWMYAFGDGVQQSDIEAAKWFLLAAKRGYALAQLHLGVAYNDGRGVAQNFAEAAKWYRLAAEQGIPMA